MEKEETEGRCQMIYIEGWNTKEMREKWERMKHKRDRRGILMEKTKERWKKSR